MLIDTHAHLNFNAYDDDREAVVSRTKEAKMAVINVGTQPPTSKMAIELAEQNENFYATVGNHPVHILPGGAKDDGLADTRDVAGVDPTELFSQIEKLLPHKKVVAIGEVGLDYFRLKNNIDETKALQVEHFKKFIKLANKHHLPLALHCRPSPDTTDAYNDILKVMNEIKPEHGGVIHCFTGTAEVAQKYVAAGYHVGFTGIVTFGKKAQNVIDAVKEVPIDKLLIETDCPFLTPDPHRGKRNEPAYVEFVAKEIARIKKMTIDEVVEQTYNNAVKLFKLNS
ncbi:hydrolase TatD [bacterium]|nr:hydrolase TatD [bacterium]